MGNSLRMHLPALPTKTVPMPRCGKGAQDNGGGAIEPNGLTEPER